jgi:glycosyltransferase involved in cell wall biosynthesis
MRVLAVNWLDVENPQAGGAEIHFFEIFRRLVDKGHHVTLVSSGWKGAAPKAEISGISVKRIGGRHTFAVLGRSAVRRVLAAGTYDIVVEDINKLPLFLTQITQLPVYVIVPHLFGTTAFSEASWPVAAIVWLAERPIPRVYRKATFHAISESTKADLVDRGVNPAAVRVILPGVDSGWFVPDPDVGRFETPTFLYVGRIKRYKGIDGILEGLALARAQGLGAKLLIAGRGDDLDRVLAVTKRLGLADVVTFLGFVGESEKRTLLRQAWALVFPSAKEGWGIANVEAEACGTPVIASDSPGLRESVLDQKTGLLVPHGDARALADAMIKIANDPELLLELGRGARTFSETLSWESAADQTESHMMEAIHSARCTGHKERWNDADNRDGAPLRDF